MPSKLGKKFEDLKDKAIEFALIPVGFVLSPIALYSLKKMHIRREIAKDVLISSDWTVIKPRSPLKIRKRFQEILLLLENCQQNILKNRENLIFSDETVINSSKQITVEILDEDGNKYNLKSGKYTIGNFDEENGRVSVSSAGFKSLKVGLPKNKTFKEVRIRSEKPFQCKTVIWHDYDMK
jgi:hypothetical protein